MEINIYKIGKELFITSDEEIKEGDWCLLDHNVGISEGYEVLKCDEADTENGWYSFGDMKTGRCKKIILTTDQDLIADGVQAIDDEFLEWFVKNPSCERVETEPIFYASGYNLDIPKEEPLPYQLKGVLDTMSQEEFDKEWKKVKGLKMESLSIFEEPKQETLEEVAERLYPTPTPYVLGMDIGNSIKRDSFIKGAKWQLEQNNTSNVTRIEVIHFYNGRVYTNYNAKNVELQYQDKGKTLKIFLK
jgi:hypothetical protein